MDTEKHKCAQYGCDMVLFLTLLNVAVGNQIFWWKFQVKLLPHISDTHTHTHRKDLSSAATDTRRCHMTSLGSEVGAGGSKAKQEVDVPQQAAALATSTPTCHYSPTSPKFNDELLVRMRLRLAEVIRSYSCSAYKWKTGRESLQKWELLVLLWITWVEQCWYHDKGFSTNHLVGPSSVWFKYWIYLMLF